MTTNHTPTPWEIREHNYGNVRGAHGLFMVGNNAPIADGIYGRNISEADANADFIVKACNAHDDLVAVLEKITDEMTRLNTVMKETWEEAQSLLAKARGE